MSRGIRTLALSSVVIVAGAIVWIGWPKPQAVNAATESAPKPTIPAGHAAVEQTKSPQSSVAHSTSTKRISLGNKAFLVNMTPPDYESDAGTYIDSRLKDARNGNSQASYEIYARVSSCERALNPGDADEYKAYASMGAGAQYSKRVENEIERCKSLINRTDVTSENWLSLAAAQGSIEARLMYARDPQAAIGTFTDALTDPNKIIDYRQNAVSYLNESIRTGNVDSIEALANIYSRGIIAERSNEKSLSYWLTLQRVNPSDYTSNSIKALSNQLQPDQIQRAEIESQEIYRSCCK